MGTIRRQSQNGPLIDKDEDQTKEKGSIRGHLIENSRNGAGILR